MINNLRDRETDKKVGKRTLATRMSAKLYIIGIYLCLMIPYSIQLTAGKGMKYLPLLALPALIKVIVIVQKNREGAILNDALKFAGIHLLVFGMTQFISLII